ncbi:heparinase II/III-family protein [Nonomuraea sp. NBC_01738]|uniref:heparinase II/III family protein n=1 Tax=Nonomuraea sp. NBC_01738 TaxID=2976003 RepID=UPI002E104033|nr:heparinase II/III-family protein [Nonomuraea sp. NBC_01738]
MSRKLGILVLVIVLAGYLVGGHRGPSLAEARGPAPCDPAQFATVSAEDVMAGKLSFVGLPAVNVGRDIDWRADPRHNRSWMLNLHTLRWVGHLVVAFESTGRQDYLDRATDIARDWVSDNPRGGLRISEWAWADHAVALRSPVLVCLSKHVKSAWLTRTLAEHAEALADDTLYKKGHNHGLDQDIALLAIGCRLVAPGWKKHALDRMIGSAELAIDPQGVLQEQAPRYGVYVHERLGVAMATMRSCGEPIPERLTARRAALEEYITHATQPDGRIVPIGDSPADMRPKGYPHDDATVRVFEGGYVFGRTAWDRPDSAYYSIRFGPAQRFHGHEDHLGVTYHASGRDILVEAGFHSYEKTAYPRWTSSPQAHNVPVVVGKRFRPGTAGRLLKSSVTSDRQTYELGDSAYGVSRTRKVLVNHGDDVMAVWDSVPAGERVRGLWHFAPSLKVVSRGGGSVVLGDGAFRVTLTQVALPSCEVVGGQQARFETISLGYLRKSRSVTVVSPAVRSVVTVIVPGAGRPAVSCAGGIMRVGRVSFPV